MSFLYPIFYGGLLLGVISCTHSIHISHMSDILPYAQKKGRFIDVEVHRAVFWDFIFDTNYVEEARQKLMNECPDAEITAINTKYITSHGFLSYTDKIRIRALCLDDDKFDDEG